MLAKRIMGKASFARLRDHVRRYTIFIQKSAVPEGRYETFKNWDLGDILGAEGVVFKTKTGELSVKVDTLRLLTKSLRPLAGEISRAGRSGNPLPAALCGLDHERVYSRHFQAALGHHRPHPRVF
jgi:hypothetical protein